MKREVTKDDPIRINQDDDMVLLRLAEKTISCFRDWNAIENGGIIDFDLVDPRLHHEIQKSERASIQTALSSLLEEFDTSFSKPYSIEAEFIRAKLDASLVYLRALCGEKLPFEDYVERTMGVRPILIPKSAIQQQAEVLEDLAFEMGYANADEALRQIRTSQILESRADVARAFQEYEERLVLPIRNWIRLDDNLVYKVELVEKDAYWYNWISTSPQGEIVLQINVSPDHHWYPAKVEVMVAHELGAHALQALAWKSQILSGGMNPLVGLTTVFTPEQFILEGLAQTIPSFFGADLLSDDAKLLYQAGFLGGLIDNNTHIRVNKGEDPRVVHHDEMSPFPWLAVNADVEVKRLFQLRDDPLLRTYQYVYGISRYAFHKIAAARGPEDRAQFVRDLFTRVFTPSRLLESTGVDFSFS